MIFNLFSVIQLIWDNGAAKQKARRIEALARLKHQRDEIVEMINESEAIFAEIKETIVEIKTIWLALALYLAITNAKIYQLEMIVDSNRCALGRITEELAKHQSQRTSVMMIIGNIQALFARMTQRFTRNEATLVRLNKALISNQQLTEELKI